MAGLTHGGLFSGIGGFSEGFRRAGIRTVWEVEIDPACRRVLRHHDPDVALYEDVREVGAHNLEPVDIITFGSPCQDLSVAGKRKGLDGERSGLYFEAIRIIRELGPAIAVWENVPGALSSHSGRDFGRALDELADIGSLDIGWAVLDAQWFGVAQRRRRVFVVADFRGERAGEILALADGLSGHPAPRRETGERPAPTLEGRAGRSGATNFHTSGGLVPSVAGTLGSNTQGGFRSTDLDQNGAFIPFDMTQVTSVANRQRLEAGREAPSLHAAGGAHVIQSFALQGAGHTSQGSQGSGWNEERCFTLNTTDVHGDAVNVSPTIVASGMAVRRLTPVECCRLQAFPDNWLDLDPPLADSTKYRMLGNAVCVNVAEWIGQRIAQLDDRGRLVWAI